MTDKIIKIADAAEWGKLVKIVLKANAAVLTIFFQKYDINVIDEEKGRTLLIEACFAGSLDAIKYLIEAGANIDLAGKDKKTPLFIASTLYPERADIVKYLIDHKASVDIPNFYPMTPLLAVAPQSCFSNNFLYLLEAGANPNYRGYRGCSALYVAAQKGVGLHVEKLLACKNIQINILTDIGETALMTACTELQVDVVRLLLAHGATVNHQRPAGESALYMTLNQPNEDGVEKELKIVEMLVKRGALINRVEGTGITPFILACVFGKTKIVKLMLKNKPDFSVQLALQTGIGQQTGFWIHRFVSAEHLNCESGIRLLRNLLGIDPDMVNWQTSYGDSPLHYVCMHGNHKLLSVLLEGKKINIDCQNQDGTTPLKFAVNNAVENGANVKKQRLYNMVEKVLNCGANPNLTSKLAHRSSPLGCAALAGRLDLVKLLVEGNRYKEKTDLNTQMQDGSTPLFMAAQEGYWEVVEYLLAHGADQAIKRNDGNSPIFMAFRESQQPYVSKGPTILQDNYAKTIQVLLDHQYKNKIAKGFLGSYPMISRMLMPEGKTMFVVMPQFEQLLQNSEVEFNLSQLFLEPADDLLSGGVGQYSSTDNTLSQQAQSARSFLQELGFTAQKINEMRRELRAEPDEIASETVVIKEEVNPLWFDGLITKDDVTEIKFGSPNCYFYFDEQVVAEADIDEHTKKKFQNASEKFCGKEGQQGLKSLNLSKPLVRQLTINGILQAKRVEICAELKIDSLPSRFFCFKVNADEPNKQFSLYVAAVFSKEGAHQKNVEDLMPQTMGLNISAAPMPSAFRPYGA